MQEVERKMGIESSRMEGEQVIRTCQEMVSFLRERSRELKDYVLNHPFSNVEEEICFFKYYKPALTGRLLYITGYTRSRAVVHVARRLPGCITARL